MNLFHSAGQVNPAILLCILLGIVIVFFVSGLVIFLVKLLKKPSFSSIFQSSGNLDLSGSSALQRQLQNLFNLHDSGLDQAVIDSLPMFIYKDIMGLNSPFDCPVCLCEFIGEDKLRLLPLCKHAFHLHCIDTWLLSSSTCPLCRNTLLNQSFELDDDSRNEGFSLSVSDNDIITTVQKPDEPDRVVQSEKKVFSLRLGKFRHHNKSRDMEMGENSVVDSRRCFSMGSVEYVVDDKEFQVELKCCDESNDCARKLIGNGNIRESFSISKVWLWPKKSKDKHFSRPFSTSLSNSMSMEEESSIVVTDSVTQGETKN